MPLFNKYSTSTLGKILSFMKTDYDRQLHVFLVTMVSLGWVWKLIVDF